MFKAFKSVSPLVKISFIISLLILFLWVIPIVSSFYKNQKLYGQKVEDLAVLDQRTEGKLNAKPFHSEVFKKNTEEYFEKVKVTPIEDNAYHVVIQMNGSKLDEFYTYLKNLSLNYAIVVTDNITYEDRNGSLLVTMILKPY